MTVRRQVFFRWFILALLVAVTFAVFLPGLKNGFVYWDDREYLLFNPHFRGWGWAQLKWMWTTDNNVHYEPLLWMLMGAVYSVWKMNPWGYHLTSLLLHSVNAVMVYFLARRLHALALGRGSEEGSNGFGCSLAAAASALFFAIHPLSVEAVSWVSATQCVLAGLFALATLMAYLRYAEFVDNPKKRRVWLFVSVVLYGCSLLSSAYAMALPIVLLLLDYYPLRRTGAAENSTNGWQRIWWEKAPYILLALLAAFNVWLIRQRASNVAGVHLQEFIPRLLLSAWSTTFYLKQTFVPEYLGPVYDIVGERNPTSWPFWVNFMVLVSLTGALIRWRKKWPAGLVVWLSFLAFLLPLSGLAQKNAQIVTDRYTYLPNLSLAFLSGGVWLWLCRSCGEKKIRPAFFFGASVMVVSALVYLGALCHRQVFVWRDSIGLMEHILSRNPNSVLTRICFGEVYTDQNRFAEATQQFELVLKLDPGNKFAYTCLGNIALAQGRLDEAAERYRQALKVDPRHFAAQLNLAVAFLSRGKLDDAAVANRKALEIDPDSLDAHNNLGVTLASQKKFGEAVTCYRRIIEIDPLYIKAYENMGIVTEAQGNFDEAVEWYQKVLKVDPEYAEAQRRITEALARKTNGGSKENNLLR